MNTPTEAHLDLALQITDALARSGNVAAAKLIADSEARAVLKQTAYLKAMVQDGTNAMKERDQLRNELSDEKNLHAQTRTVVEELNTIGPGSL